MCAICVLLSPFNVRQLFIYKRRSYSLNHSYYYVLRCIFLSLSLSVSFSILNILSALRAEQQKVPRTIIITAIHGVLLLVLQWSDRTKTNRSYDCLFVCFWSSTMISFYLRVEQNSKVKNKNKNKNRTLDFSAVYRVGWQFFYSAFASY